MQTTIPDTGGRQVDLAPWPGRIDSSGVVYFRNNGRPEFHRLKDKKIRPDIAIFCTGYKQTFPFFRYGGNVAREYPVPDEADVRNIWKGDDPSVGFIGFVRPSLGAIPPLAEMQAQLWVLNLLRPERIPRELSPEDEPHYRLLSAPTSRITYGVDHESYTYQIALDLGSAPGFFDVLRLAYRKGSWRLPIMWAFGAQLTTKFRLQGPWKWDGASDMLVSEEFWQTMTRRPILFGKLSFLCCIYEVLITFQGHFATTIVPVLIFGPLCLWFFLYAFVWELLAPTSKSRKKQKQAG